MRTIVPQISIGAMSCKYLKVSFLFGYFCVGRTDAGDHGMQCVMINNVVIYFFDENERCNQHLFCWIR